MQYRNDRSGNPVSLLGYGCMRFSKKGTGLDYDKAEAELLRGLELGINYFDTAYIYPGSESLLGTFMEKNGCRDQMKIATKLPQYMVRNISQADRFFDEEIKRLKTDYIDYYLMHMVTDVQQWKNLCELGIEEWVADKKATGAIRNIGFSFHGSTELFLEVLNAYDWDFCQIQYNYLDENTQAGRVGLQAAAAKGIPVVIMEPLRGGRLIDLPKQGRKALEESGKSWSAAEWAFRWLMEQPEVTCVLSGMNSIEMVEENCRVASEVQVGEFTEADFETIEKVVTAIRDTQKVGCTGCAYCMPCPAGVDIPALFRCYNHMYTESKNEGRSEYWQTVSLRKKKAFARQCVDCGRCESKCPQSIPIREEIHNADRALRPLPWRIAGDVARLWAIR